MYISIGLKYIPFIPQYELFVQHMKQVKSEKNVTVFIKMLVRIKRTLKYKITTNDNSEAVVIFLYDS